MRDHVHSRIVSWLKVLLPLAALALLSTIFLLSRPTDPVSDLPFAVPGLNDPNIRQQLTEPHFSAATTAGDSITMTAQTARPDPERDGVARALGLRATLDLSDGGKIEMQADSALLDGPNDVAVLTGDVLVESSTGYTLRTDELTSALSKVQIESTGPIIGDGPTGAFEAGKLLVRADDDGNNIRMLFTEGVKMLYDPQR